MLIAILSDVSRPKKGDGVIVEVGRVSRTVDAVVVKQTLDDEAFKGGRVSETVGVVSVEEALDCEAFKAGRISEAVGVIVVEETLDGGEFGAGRDSETVGVVGREVEGVAETIVKVVVMAGRCWAMQYI
jgi:hypothetical protein